MSTKDNTAPYKGKSDEHQVFVLAGQNRYDTGKTYVSTGLYIGHIRTVSGQAEHQYSTRASPRHLLWQAFNMAVYHITSTVHRHVLVLNTLNLSAPNTKDCDACTL